MDRSTTTYQGDLTDIVLKASGGCGGGGSDAALSQSTSDISTWQFSCDDSHNTTGASTDFDQFSIDDPIFGDPFCNIRDPLLHELNLAATGSTYFSNNFGSVDDRMVAASTSSACDQVLFDSNDDNSNCSMFSRIQISLDDPVSKFPVNSSFPVVVTAAAADCHSSLSGFKGVISCDNQMISVNSPKGSLIDHPGLVQIPSPRNLGIKRRKGQAKKVVCIPAPAAANNRPNSEVVPSDLWAWRKYGQKPIKGSPYPRGYYRCSSSKGCSARKQVERSRTDPNMLVITYTSEHNHPWPTQRNALAGSTRSPHPSKTNPNSSVNHSKTNKTTSTNKQDHKADTTSNNVSGTTSCAVKLEHEDHGRHTIGYSSNIAAANYREISMLPYHDTTDQDHDQFIITSNTDDQNYRPRAILMADQRSCGQPSEDFFAELGEIDSDPLDDHLLFNHHDDNQHQGFGGDHDQTSNALDPFMSSIIYDWSVNSSNNNSTSSFGEAEETSKVTSTNSDI